MFSKRMNDFNIKMSTKYNVTLLNVLATLHHTHTPTLLTYLTRHGQPIDSSIASCDSACYHFLVLSALFFGKSASFLNNNIKFYDINRHPQR